MEQKHDDHRSLELNPKSTVLVVVDMENDFCKPGGKLYHPDGVDEVIPKLKRLLEMARKAGTTVIFVQSVRDEDSPEFVRFGHFPFILKNTWGSKFIEEISPKNGEPIVEKHTHDCFYRTEMDNLLDQLKILPETHTIVVTGVAANVCVYHAVIGFHVRNYNVIVPIDCCAGWPWGRKMLETQMLDGAYNYNVKVTESDRIHFGSSSL
jgi:nicotinamidase-related amidase